jgi:hypothetical protein
VCAKLSPWSVTFSLFWRGTPIIIDIDGQQLITLVGF